MCDSPFYVDVKGVFGKVPLPCGRCPPCKRRRVNSWVFRLQQEQKISTSSHFVTFTYNTQFVPISSNGFMTLCKRDVQLFFKRLRKSTGIKNIRYFIVGEYGSKNERPHYHAIIFNCPDSSSYHKAWGLGDIHVGTVTQSSVAYTMKYLDKAGLVKKFKRDDRCKEFSLMSNGIGACYLTSAVLSYHRNNIDQLFVTRSGGERLAMPKYYRDRIFDERTKKRQIRIIQKAVDEKQSLMRSLHNAEFPEYDYDAALGASKFARMNSLINSLSLNNRKL